METSFGIVVFGIVLALSAWGWIAFIGILFTSRDNSQYYSVDKDSASTDVVLGLFIIAVLGLLAMVVLSCLEEFGA